MQVLQWMRELSWIHSALKNQNSLQITEIQRENIKASMPNLYMSIGLYILIYLTPVPECRLMYDYRSLYPTLSHPVPECRLMSDDRSLYPTLSHPCA